jgi:hypothetical protein
VAWPSALDASPHTTYIAELFVSSLCDLSGHGEGELFLGTTTMTTDATGAGSFSTTMPEAIPKGWVVTSTATDPDGNTSEFLACFDNVPQPNEAPFVVAPATDVNVDEGSPGATSGEFSDPDLPNETLMVVCSSCPIGSVTDEGDGSWSWSGTPLDGPANLSVGEGRYNFILWAGDGAPDTFRIKIWTEEENAGAETVIYDNGFDQAIGGGNSAVHAR